MNEWMVHLKIPKKKLHGLLGYYAFMVPFVFLGSWQAIYKKNLCKYSINI